MKRLISIMLAVMLIFSTVAVASAQEVDVTETSVNMELFEDLAEYIKTNGTEKNGNYYITCKYKGDSADLVSLSHGEIQIQFSSSNLESEHSGFVSLYKGTCSSQGKIESVVHTSVGIDISTKVQGTFDIKDALINNKIYKLTGTYYGPEGDENLQKSTVEFAKAKFMLCIDLVNLCLYNDLGYNLDDIYIDKTSEDNTENSDGTENNTNTESTPDSAQPNTSSTSDEASTASPHAVKTGISTFDIVMMITAAGLLFFLATTVAKKKSYK